VKNTMLQLASPSKELKKLLSEQGFASGEAAVKARGFVGVLADPVEQCDARQRDRDRRANPADPRFAWAWSG